MKLAIISIALPPSHTGQAVVLFQLLKNVKPDSYCLITQKNINYYQFGGNCTEKLPGKYYFLNPDNQIFQRFVKGLALLHLERLFQNILAVRTYQIKKILIKEKCTSVIVCTGDLFDPPAAFLACKALEIPFIIYTFDYYSRQWTDPIFRSFAEKHEPQIIKNASRVIVTNRCMQKEYNKRYGIDATIIHNPIDLEEYEKNAADSEQNNPNVSKIVYTGTIYEAHYSAFQNLITAIEKTKIPGLKLHLYTPQSVTYLEKNNITGPVVIRDPLPNQQMPKIQRNADILFLPLAFNSPYPDIIKTSSPGKIGEYLASKRPILVHAPAESFLSWYFRKYSCGFVVDQENTDKLATAIILLFSDKELERALTENAYARAKEDFDLHSEQKKFYDILNLQQQNV
jgi:glycosyltransferase involved in cell wall biosynthesis